MMSLLPPGACGTMMRIGRVGYAGDSPAIPCCGAMLRHANAAVSSGTSLCGLRFILAPSRVDRVSPHCAMAATGAYTEARWLTMQAAAYPDANENCPPPLSA